jgi:shikimate dehydrogenase
MSGLTDWQGAGARLMQTDRPLVRAGLIGSSIQASRTPRMQSAEGAAQGLDYRYERFDLDLIQSGVAALPSLLDELEAQGYVGVNVTHPCKQRVIEHLTELSPEAGAIGAVNTIVFKDGRRTGYNTDWSGYAEAFSRGLPGAALDKVVLLGAGGAGAAVAYALARLGAGQVKIVDVHPGRAEALVLSLGAHVGPGLLRADTDVAAALADADGLVHTTPTGMDKYPGVALDPDLISSRLWVSEIVYVPLETELVRLARARGCRVADGGGMAVFQAVHAFELFTGLKADVDRMYAHFDQFEPV